MTAPGQPARPRSPRIVPLLLLLANAMLLGAVLGVFGANPLAGWFETPREPQRLQQQVRGERMRVQAPASAPAADAAPRSALPSATLAACIEIGGFSAQAARRATEDLAAAALRVEAFARQEQVRWWVHLPAQPTREHAERKLAELRRRNVTEYSLVTAGTPEATTYTVSLGLFREREHAEQYLDSLRGHGVRTAMLTDAARPLTRQWLRVRDADDAARARLEAMRQRYGAEDVLACS
ncbi:SPOR domain-containing protein [Cupriavidus sp. KK10]|jgi:cell division septation protein DedD|uniref:SPOR domain-containing protein n=1 Tax=Cupriavidus sp. KK10 TaxID=1478019 RepID=UPI001BAC4BDF|nr:SPOR domain-containing protein [Cupriavidus sp. KK10]QUN28507.1 SPOR domain-containing protein [Cupriavidus sp. KK10]